MSSLWAALPRIDGLPLGSIESAQSRVLWSDLVNRSSLQGQRDALRGRRVIIATRDPLNATLAMLELDGSVQRMVLCTPDLTAHQLASVVLSAEADAIVVDSDSPHRDFVAPTLVVRACVDPALATAGGPPQATVTTEWVLLTSGTTGMPKLVAHTFDSLAGALPREPVAGSVVWSTFYDIRRYGGLQMLLRAMLGGALMVVTSPGEPVIDFLARVGRSGVTHISGTPSHWRRALISGAAGRIAPRYVRLSGEIADQAILDNLKAAFAGAGVAHAFASTEAGVAFDVTDGLAGFPAAMIDDPSRAVAMTVVDGTLRIRSARVSSGYLGGVAANFADGEGYVDTGDRVELRDGRYHFAGRRGGVINVGGLKVHPEEVEAVLNADPRVRMSLAGPRRNPITGAVVAADVVLVEDTCAPPQSPAARLIESELLQACRQALAAHKVPARLRVVESLPLSAAGKLERPGGP